MELTSLINDALSFRVTVRHCNDLRKRKERTKSVQYTTEQSITKTNKVSDEIEMKQSMCV